MRHVRHGRRVTALLVIFGKKERERERERKDREREDNKAKQKKRGCSWEREDSRAPRVAT